MMTLGGGRSVLELSTSPTTASTSGFNETWKEKGEKGKGKDCKKGKEKKIF